MYFCGCKGQKDYFLLLPTVVVVGVEQIDVQRWNLIKIYRYAIASPNRRTTNQTTSFEPYYIMHNILQQFKTCIFLSCCQLTLAQVQVQVQAFALLFENLHCNRHSIFMCLFVCQSIHIQKSTHYTRVRGYLYLYLYFIFIRSLERTKNQVKK